MSDTITLKFNNWLKDPSRKQSDIFEVSKSTVIGMGSGFLKIFHGIIKELGFLHQNNEFHGNFRDSVRVITTYSTHGSRITVYLGQRKPLPDSLDEIRDGIMSDIEALRSMVKEVLSENKFRNSTQIGPIWDLFLNQKIYVPTQDMTLHQVKKCAFYNFSSPVFLDKKGAYKLTFKLHEIRQRNVTAYEKLVDLKTPEFNMSDWKNRVVQPYFKTLLLEKDQVATVVMYYKNHAVGYFMRQACTHGRDKSPFKWAGKIWKEVREIFPDALPKMHCQICTALDSEAVCKYYFKAGIMKLLSHGPHGYKGFKVKP